MVENVIPIYAGGYGVGQMLPSAYGYYNVPYQYRSMYYDTPDYGYWYAPGAIYQYDPAQQHDHLGRGAAVAGLHGRPAAAVGLRRLQRALRLSGDLLRHADAWYRYNNGYIYRVDPTTQLVTAIVASLLT